MRRSSWTRWVTHLGSGRARRTWRAGRAAVAGVLGVEILALASTGRTGEKEKNGQVTCMGHGRGGSEKRASEERRKGKDARDAHEMLKERRDVVIERISDGSTSALTSRSRSVHDRTSKSKSKEGNTQQLAE